MPAPVSPPTQITTQRVRDLLAVNLARDDLAVDLARDNLAELSRSPGEAVGCSGGDRLAAVRVSIS